MTNSDTNTEIQEEESRKVDVLLTHYEQMRQEFRIISQTQSRRFTRGTAALAAIIGSAFVSEQARILVTIIPFLLFFIFVRQIQSANWSVKIEAHIVDIQREIDVPSFNWEQEYGSHSTDHSEKLEATTKIQGVIAILAYLVASLAGIQALQDFGGVELPLVTVTPTLAGIGYVITGFSAIWVVYSHRRIRSKEYRG